jgi:hypothetical protein
MTRAASDGRNRGLRCGALRDAIVESADGVARASRAAPQEGANVAGARGVNHAAHVASSPRNRHFALAVAAILLAASFVEVSRIVVQRPWGVLPAWASNAAGAVLASLWTLAAVSLLLRDRGRVWAKAAFVLAIASPAAMCAHGLITGAVFAPIGLCYVLLAAVLAMLVKGAFGRGELLRLRHEHHLDDDPALEASARHAAGSQRTTP